MHYLILRYRNKWMLAFNGLWWISQLWISLVVIFGDYLGLEILLKLIIDGKSVIRVDLNEWTLELYSYWEELRKVFRPTICVSLKNKIKIKIKEEEESCYYYYYYYYFVIRLFLNYGKLSKRFYSDIVFM